jgi:hypothetical protein
MTARLRLVGEGEGRPSRAPAPGIPRALKAIAGVAGLAAALALYVASTGAEGRALRSLAEPERRALLARTLDNLRTVCRTPAEGIRDFCADQASLAIEFRECDADCRGLAAAQLARSRAAR